MKTLYSIIIFLIAGFCEISGGWMIWKWLKDDRSSWWGFFGGISIDRLEVVNIQHTREKKNPTLPIPVQMEKSLSSSSTDKSISCLNEYMDFLKVANDVKICLVKWTSPDSNIYQKEYTDPV